MGKYRVMADSRRTGSGQFTGIELELILDDDSIGTECNVLGGVFLIVQNGKILVLSNDDWVLTLMDITPAPKVVKPKLVVNDTLDVYFKTSEIRVGVDCTYKELYDALVTEWKIISKLDASQMLPVKYDEEMKLLTFLNDWKLSDGSLQHLSGGSYSRLNKQGRYV